MSANSSLPSACDSDSDVSRSLACFNSLYGHLPSGSIETAAKEYRLANPILAKNSSLIYGEIEYFSFIQLMETAMTLLFFNSATHNSNPSTREYSHHHPFIYCDLGSGSGKTLAATALNWRCSRLRGIELLEPLHELAEKMKQKLNSMENYHKNKENQLDQKFIENANDEKERVSNLPDSNPDILSETNPVTSPTPIPNSFSALLNSSDSTPIPLLPSIFSPSESIFLHCGDILSIDWSESDVVFACSTCFSIPLVRGISVRGSLLKSNSVVITLTDNLIDCWKPEFDSPTSIANSSNSDLFPLNQSDVELIPIAQNGTVNRPLSASKFWLLVETKELKMSWGSVTVNYHRRR